MARLPVGNGSAQKRKTAVPEIADELQQAQRGREALSRRDSVRTVSPNSDQCTQAPFAASYAMSLTDSTAVLKG